jgi:putative chitinase
MITFDRDIYFAEVRQQPFGGHLTQEQVNGQNFLLDAWERNPLSEDLRHLAYALATTMHETSSTMLPIEEYGKGQGMAYGKKDPQTGQTYYGRGYVQLTWRDNYVKATRELGLEGDDDLEWHAARALDPMIAAHTLYLGMTEGWFRGDSKGRQTLARYFDHDTDDPYGAREIVNGDKHIVPNWSGGVSIGKLIAGYHKDFLMALHAAVIEIVAVPEPEPEPLVVTVRIVVPPGVVVKVEQDTA